MKKVSGGSRTRTIHNMIDHKTAMNTPQKRLDKVPNVNKIFVHPFKNKRKIQNCILDPNKETNAKVINAFIKIMMYEIDQDGKEDVFKANFMNDAMLVYARRKNEVDTLTRTFENLSQCNSTFRLNKSSRLSPKPKQKSAKTFGNINGYSKMTSKGKDISSRLKISGLSTNKTVFNDSKSNIKLYVIILN